MNERDLSWKAEAACRELDPAVFFPDPTDRVGNERAVAVCAGCPVREECLAFALRTREHFGVWGGLTEVERHRRARWSSKRGPLPEMETACVDCGALRLSVGVPRSPYCEECRRKARIQAQYRWRYVPA